MAKKDEVKEKKPWERLEKESTPAYEAFREYRDMGEKRSIAKVAEELGKSVKLLERWSAQHDWQKRVLAWDDEIERVASEDLLKEIAKMRARQRKQALKMQLKGMQLLDGVNLGDAKLGEITSLIKTGMEQERIVMGDVGDVIEERSGEAVSPVQIYVPDNGRTDKDTFDDLEVEEV